MERFVDSPLAHLSAAAGLDPAELEGLADWATAKLRPDVTILLDRDPSTMDAERARPPEHHWQVQRVLTEMAAADPDRYVVVDADGTPEQVAVRVRIAVQTALAGRRQGNLLPSDSLAPVEVKAT
jgi:dTMP kinase